MEARNPYKTQITLDLVFSKHRNWWIAERLAEFMAGLMTDQKYSDLTLECDGEKFPVHKAVVLRKSDVLEKACQEHWREGEDNVIHITEFDAQTVRRMVEFFYSGDYDQGKPEYVLAPQDSGYPGMGYSDESSDSEDDSSFEDDDDAAERKQRKKEREAAKQQEAERQREAALRKEKIEKEWAADEDTAANGYFDTFAVHLSVHAIADYYMVRDLKYMALNKINFILEDTPWSTMGFLAVAKEAFETTMSPSVTRSEAYGQTLRNLIVNKADENFKEIAKSKGFVKSELNPEFAGILLQKIATQYEDVCERLEREERQNDFLSKVRTTAAKEESAMRADIAGYEACIDQIQNLTSCYGCGRSFNVLIREREPPIYDLPGKHFDTVESDVLANQLQAALTRWAVECKRCSPYSKYQDQAGHESEDSEEDVALHLDRFDDQGLNSNQNDEAELARDLSRDNDLPGMLGVHDAADVDVDMDNDSSGNNDE